MDKCNDIIINLYSLNANGHQNRQIASTTLKGKPYERNEKDMEYEANNSNRFFHIDQFTSRCDQDCKKRYQRYLFLIFNNNYL